MSTEFVFDCDVQEVPIELKFTVKRAVEGAEPVIEKITKNCVLVEMMGDQRDTWMNNISKRSEISGSGKNIVSKITNFEKSDAEMVFGCLLVLPERKPMSIDDLQKLPTRVMQAICKKLREMSGLDDDEETDAKND